MVNCAIPTAIVIILNVQRMLLGVPQEMVLGVLKEIVLMVSFATEMECVQSYALNMQLVVRQEMELEIHKEIA